MKSTKPNQSQLFISNPLQMVNPSYRALKVNSGALVSAILIMLGAGFGGVVVLAVLFLIFHAHAAALVFLLGTIGVIAFMYLGLRMAAVFPIIMLAAARGQVMSFDEAWVKAKTCWGRVFVVNLLAGLAALGGLILLIIPGIIFQAWFIFGQYAVIDENLSAVEALKRSKQLVKGRVFEVLGLESVPQIIGVLNVIPFLGGLVILIFSFIWLPAAAIRFEQLKMIEKTDPKPAVAGVNYALIVIAVLLIPVTVIIGINQARDAKTTTSTNPPAIHY